MMFPPRCWSWGGCCAREGGRSCSVSTATFSWHTSPPEDRAPSRHRGAGELGKRLRRRTARLHSGRDPCVGGVAGNPGDHLPPDSPPSRPSAPAGRSPIGRAPRPTTTRDQDPANRTTLGRHCEHERERQEACKRYESWCCIFLGAAQRSDSPRLSCSIPLLLVQLSCPGAVSWRARSCTKAVVSATGNGPAVVLHSGVSRLSCVGQQPSQLADRGDCGLIVAGAGNRPHPARAASTRRRLATRRFAIPGALLRSFPGLS